MKPMLDRLAAAQAKRSPQKTAPAVSPEVSMPSANFGGYVNGTSYPPTAASINTFDPSDGFAENVITADFDKDGHQDVATVSYDGSLNIFLNNGAGGLADPVGYPNSGGLNGAFNTWNAFAADLNGDGYPDIIIYDYQDGLLLTYINAAGTFGTPVQTTLSKSLGQSAGVAVGDVNGDGKSDVLVAFDNTSVSPVVMTVQTLLGNGNGGFTVSSAATFTGTSQYLAGLFPIALGDLNGDGKLDLAALTYTQTYSASTGFSYNFAVTTALGNGDGTFAQLGVNAVDKFTSPSPNSITGLFLLDLNKDGKQDLAVATANKIYTALGSGTNVFHVPLSSSLPNTIGLLPFGDLNGDGYPDAVTQGTGVLSIFPGKGDGTFLPPVEKGQYVIDAPNYLQPLALADINGDNKTDIVDLSLSLVTLLNNGDGTLHGPVAVSVPAGSSPDNVSLGTVVNDPVTGYSDLVLPTMTPGAPYAYAGISDGKGNFDYTGAFPNGVPAGFAIAFIEPIQADFNGDGLQDLVIAGTTGQLWVALAKGDGTFLTPVAAPMPALGCPVSYGTAGDVNGDGKLDFVVAFASSGDCTGSYSTGYIVLLGNGDGTFQTAQYYAETYSALYSATLSDLNGDGILDLVLNYESVDFYGDYEPQVTVQLGSGSGTFGAATILNNSDLVSDVKIADVTGDGKPDILLAAKSITPPEYGTPMPDTGGIFLYQNNGSGTFAEPTALVQGHFISSLAIADMNGDSVPDILAQSFSPNGGGPDPYNGFLTLIGEGGGTFAPPYTQRVDPESGIMLVGNFFNDNAPDVALQEPNVAVGIFLGQGGSMTTLTDSAPTIAVGETERFTVTVTAAMANRPDPTGTVSFYDGTALLGTTALSGGTASYSSSSLAAGAHSITAVYSGDGNFNVANSNAVSVTVVQSAPTVALSYSPQSPVYGSALTLTAKITSSGSGAPTGTIRFLAGVTPLGTATVNTSGTASITIKTLSPGMHSLTAVYSGDSTHAPGTSAAVPVTIAKAQPSLTVMLSSSTPVYGSALTITATFTYPGTAPTGKVTFYAGVTPLGSATPTNGVATLTDTSLAVGSHSISASFAGDGYYSPVKSASPVTVTVEQQTTAITLTSSATSITAGSAVTFTAKVTDSQSPAPTGRVKFLAGVTPLGTTTLGSGGTAALTITTLTPGTHSITAVYGGDSIHAAVTSKAVSISVIEPATVKATPHSTTVYVGASDAVAITVAAASGSAVPTGTVTLSGSGYTSAATTLTKGAASITIPANSLAVGTDTLTAAYSGDTNFSAASTKFQITVTSAPPGFALAGQSTTLTLSPGATTGNTEPITITPQAGFTGSVTLAAALTSSPAGAVDPPTFSFGSTSPVTLNGASPATATLTISTTAPATSSAMPRALTVYAAGGAVLGCLVLGCIPARRRAWRNLFALVLCLGLYGSLTACGGSSSKGTGTPPANPGTTPGSYQVQVTATSNSINATTTIALTIQ